MNADFKAALRRVDWLRVAHRLSTLARSLRGDGRHLEADHVTEQERAAKMRKSLEGVAREVRQQGHQ